MKKLSLFILFIPVLWSFISKNQVENRPENHSPSAASDCELFIIYKEGSTFEITSYNAKDKEESRSLHKVVKSSENGGNWEIEMESKLFDKGNKEVYQGTYRALCENGVFKVDMQSLMNMEQLRQSLSGMEVTMEGENVLQLPANPKVGDQLPDGQIVMKVNMGGAMNMGGFSLSITNRKVAGKESITTPAGTFDCLKITYDSETKVMMSKLQSSHVEYFCKGVGMVRSEYYDKKGKLTGYSVLTKLNQ